MYGLFTGQNWRALSSLLFLKGNDAQNAAQNTCDQRPAHILICFNIYFPIFNSSVDGVGTLFLPLRGI